jgi:hypothetical protein
MVLVTGERTALDDNALRLSLFLYLGIEAYCYRGGDEKSYDSACGSIQPFSRLLRQFDHSRDSRKQRLGLRRCQMVFSKEHDDPLDQNVLNSIKR